MHNKFNLLVIGGDKRNIEVVKRLKNVGIHLQVCGFDKIANQMNVDHRKLSNVDYENLDAILLPVSGTNDEGKIELDPFSENELFVNDNMIQNTPDHCTIYTGISNAYLDKLAQQTNRQLVRLFTRDDMAILNSIPTAEGTLEIAMRETEIMIHGAKVLIVGFGRVGMTVARLFSQVGARVGVSARQPADLARSKEMLLTPINLKDLHNHVNDYDIIINTIPHQIIDYHILSKVKTSALIVDLASASGGVDFEAAQARGINAIHALGLPGKVAPISAGKFIADVLIDLLNEQ